MYTMQMYALDSGRMLCSLLFDAPLTAVTMDTLQTWLFVGATNGSITQLNLFLPVSPWMYIRSYWQPKRVSYVFACCLLSLCRMCTEGARRQLIRASTLIKATRERLAPLMLGSYVVDNLS